MKDAVQRANGPDKEEMEKLIQAIKNNEETGKSISVALGSEVSELMDRCSTQSHATQYEKELTIVVENRKALFSTCYERFPGSCSPVPGKRGTFKYCEDILPEVAHMGFDVQYLPPIHPIGKTHRKGKNHNPVTQPDDMGSTWAMGMES